MILLQQIIQKEVFFMWGILVAIISGALMSVQGVFNTEVTKQTSIWLSADRKSVV